MANPSLFQHLNFGALELKHRVVLAPLTRNRAGAANVPTGLVAEYYSQRASNGGLLITEATQIMPEGQGYPSTPGIHSEEQIAGWQKVTEAVHASGGLIVLQLWHVGRISHSSFQPDGKLPGAPSAIAPSGETMTADFRQVPFETPRELTLDEIKEIVATYKTAAKNAKRAGFDGVEVHGANGYLPDQFLHDGTNHRTDDYGGSLENRARFLLEATRGAIEVFGADRVGVRLSPYGKFNDMFDSDSTGLFTYVMGELSKLGLAYLHVLEPRWTVSDDQASTVPDASSLVRSAYSGPFVSCGGYTPDTAEIAVRDGKADAIAFGRWFISNPDLPERIRNSIALTPYDRSTFFGGTEKGYTDYPFAK